MTDTNDVPTSRDRALARVHELMEFRDGWCGPGSRRPNSLEAALAWIAVDLSLELGVDPPQVAPLSDGGLQLEWRHRGREIHASCVDAGVAILEVDAGGVEREDDAPARDPEVALRAALGRLVGVAQLNSAG